MVRPSTGRRGKIGAFQVERLEQRVLLTGDLPDALKISHMGDFIVTDHSPYGTNGTLQYGFGFPQTPTSAGSQTTAGRVQAEPLFLGTRLDTGELRESAIEEGLFGDKYGGEVRARFAGRAGVDLGVYVDAGLVSVEYSNASAALTVPDVTELGSVAVTSSFDAGRGSLQTTSPRFGAYADLVMELNAQVGATACVIGCVSGDIPLQLGVSEELFAINRNFDDEIRTAGEAIAQYLQVVGSHEKDEEANDDNGRKQQGKKAGGAGIGITVDFGESETDLLGAQIDVGVGASLGPLGADLHLGTMDFTLPKVDLAAITTTSEGVLEASSDQLPALADGTDPTQLANFRLDMVPLLNARFPVLSGAGKYSASLADFASIEIQTLSYLFGPSLHVDQDVQVQPKPVMRLDFSSPTPVKLPGGKFQLVDQVQFDPSQPPEIRFLGRPFEIASSFEFDAQFSNTVDLTLDLNGRLEALGFGLEVAGESVIDVGPLITDDHKFDDDRPIARLFQKSFDLQPSSETTFSPSMLSETAVIGQQADIPGISPLEPLLASTGPNNDLLFKTRLEGVLEQVIKVVDASGSVDGPLVGTGDAPTAMNFSSFEYTSMPSNTVEVEEIRLYHQPEEPLGEVIPIEDFRVTIDRFRDPRFERRGENIDVQNTLLRLASFQPLPQPWAFFHGSSAGANELRLLESHNTVARNDPRIGLLETFLKTARPDITVLPGFFDHQNDVTANESFNVNIPSVLNSHVRPQFVWAGKGIPVGSQEITLRQLVDDHTADYGKVLLRSNQSLDVNVLADQRGAIGHLTEPGGYQGVADIRSYLRNGEGSQSLEDVLLAGSWGAQGFGFNGDGIGGHLWLSNDLRQLSDENGVSSVMTGVEYAAMDGHGSFESFRLPSNGAGVPEDARFELAVDIDGVEQIRTVAPGDPAIFFGSGYYADSGVERFELRLLDAATRTADEIALEMGQLTIGVTFTSEDMIRRSSNEVSLDANIELHVIESTPIDALPPFEPPAFQSRPIDDFGANLPVFDDDGQPTEQEVLDLVNVEIDQQSDLSQYQDPILTGSERISLEVPRMIGDNATVTSSIFVAESLTLDDLDVRLDIVHARLSDLSITLIGPAGQRIELVSGLPAGAHLRQTILDDQAVETLERGSAPFFGRFQPVQPLASLNGTSTRGVWSLEIADHGAGENGELRSWGLTPRTTVVGHGFESLIVDSSTPPSPVEGVNEPDPNVTVVAGSSPVVALAGVTGTNSVLEFLLSTYDTGVLYYDVLRNGDRIASAADGTPLPPLPISNEERQGILGAFLDDDPHNNNLPPEIATGSHIGRLGVTDPIFVEAPDAALYEYAVSNGFLAQSIYIDPYFNDNAFLDGRFDLFLENAAGQFVYNGTVIAGQPFAIPGEGASRFRIAGRALPNAALHSDVNKSAPSLVTTTGFIVTPTNPPTGSLPSITMTAITDRKPVDTIARRPGINADTTLPPGSPTTLNDGVADRFRLVRAGSDLQAYVNGTLAASLPFASLPEFVVGGSDDDDTLIIDFTGGPIDTSVTFNSHAGVDAIEITGIREDSDDTQLDLRHLFSDASLLAASDLTFEINSDTNDPDSPLFLPSIDTGILTLDYQDDQNGDRSFAVRATDARGATVEQQFTVSVTPVNDVVTANLGNITAPEDVAVSIDLLTLVSADVETPDADLMFTVSNPTHGSVSLVGNIATFTPDVNFSGAGRFDFTATDTGDGDNTGAGAPVTVGNRVNVTITAVNDQPTARAKTISTLEDASISVDLLAFVDDAETPKDQLSLSVSQSVNGSVVLDGTTATFTPTADYDGTTTFRYTVIDKGDGDGTGAGAPSQIEAMITVNVINLVDLSGKVFDDRNNDGAFNGLDSGLEGISVELIDQTTSTVLATELTDSLGGYSFNLNLGKGTYQLFAVQAAGLLDGQESAGLLGGIVLNGQDSNLISDITVDLGDPDSSGYNFAEIRESRLQGLVWEDFNDDSLVDMTEGAIEGVSIRLTGLDDRGQAVDRLMQTDGQGIYEFGGLRPSGANGYQLTQTQPATLEDGKESLGTVNGVPTGVVFDNLFSLVTIPQPGSDGMDYNFGERPGPGAELRGGQAASIGFWQNKKGQDLIKSLNDGPNSTQLADWLAQTFPNIYGSDSASNDLTGRTNLEVADFYKSLFRRNKKDSSAGPPKLDAQIMAVSLAVYVTRVELAGHTAEDFGFHVTQYGVGITTYNVGTLGAAFGLEDNREHTVLDLLLAVDERSSLGLLYDRDGNGSIDELEDSFRRMANEVFSDINETGGR